MSDLRWGQVADILVNYSTNVQQGEKVLITMMEIDTFPLACAVFSKAVKAGGLPHIEFQSAYIDRELMLHGTMDQIGWVPELHAYGMEWADVYIGLRGARNPHEVSGISAERITARKKAMGEVSAMRTELTRWVLSRIPNEALAQQAEMSLDAMMAFYFNATIRDWKVESKRYQKLRDIFQVADNVRIVGRETDLKFSTKGRKYAIGEGHRNMPDGEIFTAPVDDSAEGYIYFEFPGVYAGKYVEGIRLEFSKGRVVKATAQSNEELLQSVLEVQGADRIGEFGVGTNFGIEKFIGDILYDEKIGGTIHLALGRAYAECNGINQSPIHWDIIKDIREEGEIILDGKVVSRNGKFLV